MTNVLRLDFAGMEIPGDHNRTRQQHRDGPKQTIAAMVDTRECLGEDCHNNAGDLQCPTCLKRGIKDSYFCSQDCFKKNWVCLLYW